MIHIQVGVHLLPVENRVKMDIFQDDVYQVKLPILILNDILFFLATPFLRRTASLSSNINETSAINPSSSSSSQISSNSSESLRTQHSYSEQYYRCKKIISERKKI
jgi:hypothetical protein